MLYTTSTGLTGSNTAIVLVGVCGCGCGSLRMREFADAGGCGFKRFVRLVLRLEIGAFAGYF